MRDSFSKTFLLKINLNLRDQNNRILFLKFFDDVDSVTVLKTPTRIISDNITSSVNTTTKRLEDNSLFLISVLTNFFYNKQSSNLFFTGEFDFRTL